MPDESENSVSAPVCGVAQLGRPRVVAVVVTYNRQDLLPITLAGIAAGQVVPDAVVVVDNASTDSTAEYLKNLSYSLPLDVITLSQNMGVRVDSPLESIER